MQYVPNPLPYAAAPNRRRHSRLAVAAVAIVSCEFVLIAVASAGHIGGVLGRAGYAAEQWALWNDVGVEVDLVVGVLGVNLCLAALCRPSRKRWLAVVVLPVATAVLAAVLAAYLMRFHMPT